MAAKRAWASSACVRAVTSRMSQSSPGRGLQALHSGHGQLRVKCRPLPRCADVPSSPGGAVLVEGYELRPKHRPLLWCHKECKRLADEILLPDSEQGCDGAIRLAMIPWLSVTRYPSGAKSKSA